MIKWCPLLFSLLYLYGCRSDFEKIKSSSVPVHQQPIISPHYCGITLPYNIAPMNFALMDSCSRIIAEISSDNGSPIIVWGKDKKIIINKHKWKALLRENAGNTLRIILYTKKNRDAWIRYKPIENRIALESVDSYCTYRLLSFLYNKSRALRLCQRDLTSFAEKELISTQNDRIECVNCHIPIKNDPGTYVLQVRSNRYGSETLIAEGDSITTLSSQLGHTAWHPDGRYIAFTVYKVQQYFHAVGAQFIDVYDNNSHIVIYDARNRRIVPVPQLNRKGVLTTWPDWSPDGKYMYYSSAPVLWEDYDKEPPDNFNKTRYSLLRIAFDGEKMAWGKVDTVLSSVETEQSIVQPKVSPDNKFCLFVMQDFGAYPHTEKSSDLCLLNIATGTYKKLPINSAYNESWHSWSDNSRWLLFSSKRGGGIFTRLYLCYVDTTGNVHTPFILPQKDPLFYDSFIYCYNVPEFATVPVQFSQRELFKAIKTKSKIEIPLQGNTDLR